MCDKETIFFSRGFRRLAQNVKTIRYSKTLEVVVDIDGKMLLWMVIMNYISSNNLMN